MKPDSIGGRGRRWTFPFGARTNNVVINVAIVSCAVLVTFGIFEFVVFRFVLPAPDVPQPVFQDGVVKYAPHQRGINRVGDEIPHHGRSTPTGGCLASRSIRRPNQPAHIALP